MEIKQNVRLAEHSTMRLGGIASYSCDVTSRDELTQALAWASEQNLPICVIGSGSNVIWDDAGFNGLLIVNRILRFELYNQDAETTYLTVGAGEAWDSVVERSVSAGLTGIEALSLIPGTAGATPIQNVGAYGQDISQTLTTIEAYDVNEKQFVTIPSYDCDFAYRTSRFKSTDRGRYIITAITLHLTRTNPLPPYYPAVTTYLDANKLSATPATLRQAVIAIRSSKLPDPAVIGNTGSFFANPVITANDFAQLNANHGPIPHWDTEEGVKISAAWLIEQAGFKDFHDQETGMATWAAQPLVIINEKAKTTADLMKFRELIVNGVATKFGIQLDQEPELLP